MRVHILDFTTGKERLLCTVGVDDHGKPVIQGNIPQRIRDDINDAAARAISSTAFLQSLPQEFSGSYIRAVLVDA